MCLRSREPSAVRGFSRLLRPFLRGQGFTLIELLVVVVIISFLGAVVAPALLARFSQEAETADLPSEPIQQAPPSAVAGPDSTGRQALQPVFLSARLALDVAASHALEGFGVFTRYDASYRGTFVIRNADPVSDTLTLRFPFPPGVNEVRDVSLRFQSPTGELLDPPGVRYGLEGIEWTGQVPPGTAVTAVVAYTARGRDALTYDVVGRGRSGSVQVEVRLRNAPRIVVPPEALQPTRAEGSTLRWQFASLITDKPIVLELPAGTSPLGRVILALQLAGLAVLLFGAGFWYMSEGQEPGRLDSFRWGHFLLLALNYSLFFAIYAVLGYRGSTALALGIASLVSLPLLTLHVARITDLRFALSRVLPLAALTTGTVVTVVYVDRHRALVLLAAAVALVAFLTLTYEEWLKGRLHFEEKERSRREAEARQRQLASASRELSELTDGQLQLRRRAEQELAEAPAGLAVEGGELRRLLGLHQQALSYAREAVEDADLFEAEDAHPLEEEIPETTESGGIGEGREAGGDEPEAVLAALDRVRQATELLERRGESLESARLALQEEARESRERLRQARRALVLALGEASALEEDARLLVSASPTRPATSELRRSTERLAEVRARARELEGDRWEGTTDVRALARAAELHAGILAERTGEVHEAMDRARSAMLLAETLEPFNRETEAETHCLSCGASITPDQHYCAICGIPRPLTLSCPGCGQATRLPQHLLAKGWKKRSLHCTCCGEELPSLIRRVQVAES